MPKKEDYYIKNGRWIPNSSKNPKRTSPKLNILLSFRSGEIQTQGYGFKNIEVQSKYY
jgi:hypothetical protein